MGVPTGAEHHSATYIIKWYTKTMKGMLTTEHGVASTFK